MSCSPERPYLTTFKQQRYGGKGIAAELARQGYVVIAIDMFYWGERRRLLENDPAAYRERPRTMTEEEITTFNRRSSQNEQLVARSIFTAGVTWPGIVLWDVGVDQTVDMNRKMTARFLHTSC